MQPPNNKHVSSFDDTPADEVTNKIFTIPNLISIVRLCLVPIFLVLLYEGYDIVATLLFAIAAGTDWIDGQVARKTKTVSKLGQLLDPAVDRILIFSGVLGLLMVSRLPLWIVILIVVRDGTLLLGGAYLLKHFKMRIPVVFAGKAATTFLFVGFAGLLLNWPIIPGLGITDVSWLPGFNGADVSWGIWFVYIGLVLSLLTGAYYLYTAYRKLQVEKTKMDRSNT